MATENPIESVGVYNLPEAQIDRFIFKLLMDYPEKKEEIEIMKQNINIKDFEEFRLKKIISPKEIIKMQRLARKVHLSKEIENYIVEITEMTRNKKSKHGKFIEWGASPRASIFFFIASKAEALMNGRSFVTPADVKKVALDILRHRLILNYEAETGNITADSIINDILKEVRSP